MHDRDSHPNRHSFTDLLLAYRESETKTADAELSALQDTLRYRIRRALLSPQDDSYGRTKGPLEQQLIDDITLVRHAAKILCAYFMSFETPSAELRDSLSTLLSRFGALECSGSVLSDGTLLPFVRALAQLIQAPSIDHAVLVKLLNSAERSFDVTYDCAHIVITGIADQRIAEQVHESCMELFPLIRVLVATCFDFVARAPHTTAKQDTIVPRPQSKP